jgi:hypothetical protein
VSEYDIPAGKAEKLTQQKDPLPLYSYALMHLFVGHA